jgi:hypothetical protein
MNIDLEQLKEIQENLFKQQCDLDIQKAMVKHFIKKKEDEQLILSGVVKSFYCHYNKIDNPTSCKKSCAFCKDKEKSLQ